MSFKNGSEVPSESAAGRSRHWKIKARTFKFLGLLGILTFHTGLLPQSAGPDYVTSRMDSFMPTRPALCGYFTSLNALSGWSCTQVSPSGVSFLNSEECDLQKQMSLIPLILNFFLRQTQTHPISSVLRYGPSKVADSTSVLKLNLLQPPQLKTHQPVLISLSAMRSTTSYLASSFGSAIAELTCHMNLNILGALN